MAGAYRALHHSFPASGSADRPHRLHLDAARAAHPPGDRYSETQQAAQIPPYFIYSPDGDVTAPLVYVNFGLREDYAELARRGISTKGKIVLIRYGRMWRGGKVELAAEHGAIGALLYSDPHEDGYF